MINTKLLKTISESEKVVGTKQVLKSIEGKTVKCVIVFRKGSVCFRLCRFFLFHVACFLSVVEQFPVCRPLHGGHHILMS